MPMRLVVILLGRLLPLLQSTAVPGVPLLQSAASGRPTAATYMHTIATLAQGQDQTVLSCSARSAEVCGLRVYIRLRRPVGNLGHFHPQAQPPRGSSPDPNTRFPPGTLLLFEGTRSFSHNHPDGAAPAKHTT